MNSVSIPGALPSRARAARWAGPARPGRRRYPRVRLSRTPVRLGTIAGGGSHDQMHLTLSAVDAGFLDREARRRDMHIGGLVCSTGRLRRCPTSWRICLAAAPRPALPAEARLPADRHGLPCGRHRLQPRVPRPPHGAARPGRREGAARSRAHLLPAPGPLEAALGAVARRGLDLVASPSSARPTTPWSTASRASTSSPSCSTSRRRHGKPLRPPEWAPRARADGPRPRRER